jgi:microcystin degradation protein MlrC
MRIAIGGVSHEGTTFSPILTGMEDLTVTRGDALLPTGKLRQLYDENHVELIPTLFARGVPSGILKKGTYLALKNEILDGLKSAGTLDGICLSLHGAMEVEDIGDGESDLVGAIRALVGDGVLISASLDLHGNITPELIGAADILTALRTAPHRDGEETRYRAASLLIRALKEGLKPEMVMIPVPLLLPGEKVITEVEPAASLYAMLEEVDRVPGILTSSIMVGFAWADVPHASASVIVVAEREREIAHKQAVKLAEAFWARREKFTFDVESCDLDEAIDRALASDKKPVFISDSGDNPTAGATGDIPLVVERLLAKNVPDAVVASIVDPDVVNTCVAAGLNAQVTVAIGGKLDAVHGAPLTVTGKVALLSDDAGEKIAVLRVKGVDVILTSKRGAFVTPGQFEALNIDVFAREIIVVKLGYLFPALRDIAPRAIMALSPGVSNEVIENLPFHRVRRPIFPLERDFAWKPR